MLLVAVTSVVGCRSSTPGGTRTAEVELPAIDAAAIRSAIQTVNAAGPVEWRVEEAHRAHGLSFERYRFDGGPSVLLVLGPSGAVATHMAWFDTGAMDDGDHYGLTGAIVESLQPDDADVAEPAAGFTWHTAYWRSTTTVDELPGVVQRTAEVLRDPTKVTDRALTAAKVAHQVWSQGRLASAFEAVASQRIGGPALTNQLVQDRLRTKFRSTAATIVLAGAIDRETSLAMLGRAYEPADQLPEPPAATVGPTPRLPLELSTPGTLRRGFVWWPLRSASVEDHVAIEGIANVLARRAPRTLQPMGASAVQITHRGGREGALSVAVELSETLTATAAADAIRELLNDVSHGETTGLEVEQAQATIVADRLQSASALEGRAIVAARAFLEYGELSAISREAAVISAVGERDLRRVAQQHFVDHRPVLVVGRPKAQAKKAAE